MHIFNNEPWINSSSMLVTVLQKSVIQGKIKTVRFRKCSDEIHSFAHSRNRVVHNRVNEISISFDFPMSFFDYFSFAHEMCNQRTLKKYGAENFGSHREL
mmetsp:Transcript_19536/g.23949  ORF Transcript_19536/g.23949 Transcript_19536/m.23949 type:complete len:100 (-) Transcript_19536:280-579(-)